MTDENPGMPLEGLKVIELATIVAGPSTGKYLADFGADVIKVEHPKTGDTTRGMGYKHEGVALWWKLVGRNKRPVTLNLSHPKGQEIARRLLADADAMIENFRPGTLERWDLAPDALAELNPRLIVLRISGFGQTGPYARKPGFGTLAESISGVAHISGMPDGPPMLPAIALADEVAGLVGAYAVLMALHERDRSGKGQVIDASLYESLFQLTGPLAMAYDKLGVVMERIGNRIAYSAPRNAYRTADGHWVGVSGTAQTVAERIFRAIGRPELITDPRFATNNDRLANIDELDAVIGDWIGAHPLDEVVATFEAEGAAVAPIYDARQIFDDPQYQARGSIATVEDDELGTLRMQDVTPRLSRTPGRIRHAGLPLGAANGEVYGALGISPEELAALKAERVI
ncbi:MAG TPA: CoA transferase [Actinomycetota bacterium]|nr:CoA transferase [Actinomycetota bacterium]